MKSRRVFLVTSVVAVTACGISAVGEYLDKPLPAVDGGRDGPFLLPDGAPIDGGGDGGVDANPVDLCPNVCEAGTCDAGTCVIECTDAAAPCFAGEVKCPPGVPCAVQCAVKDGCLLGVDCAEATSCNVACTGEATCAGGVKCSGAACSVECTGPAGTCAQGIKCDASLCNLYCSANDCKGAPVVCSGDDCNVVCGVDGSADKDACKKGVECNARNSCLIDCLGEATCQDFVKVATDGGARVRCLAFDACKDGLIDVRARDASIVCGADDSCEASPITCRDAGACAFDCILKNDKAISLCCPPGGCTGDSGACDTVTPKCP